jgi:hypothetical protein
MAALGSSTGARHLVQLVWNGSGTMIDPYVLIAGTALAVVLLMGSGFAMASRRADIAAPLVITALPIAAAVVAYATGVRAHFYDVGTIAVVEIVQSAESAFVKDQDRVSSPRFSAY